jgi:undecaprenyl diphosphate synthase
MDQGNIRLEVVGRWHHLPDSLRQEIQRDMARTRNNQGLRLFLALNYGGRAEIVDAARALAEKVQRGQLDPADFTEELLARHLYAPDVPDPELLIRTGGEMRLSNFLLWQSAYAELWVTPVLWPDFTPADLYRALYEFQQRNRRFGGL